jgi:hypothetical protein
VERGRCFSSYALTICYTRKKKSLDTQLKYYADDIHGVNVKHFPLNTSEVSRRSNSPRFRARDFARNARIDLRPASQLVRQELECLN